MAYWSDTLEDWTREQVVYGLRTWDKAQATDKTRIAPKPYDIEAILLLARGIKENERMRIAVVPECEPEPVEQITDEQRAETAAILASFAKRKNIA